MFPQGARGEKKAQWERRSLTWLLSKGTTGRNRSIFVPRFFFFFFFNGWTWRIFLHLLDYFLSIFSGISHATHPEPSLHPSQKIQRYSLSTGTPFSYPAFLSAFPGLLDFISYAFPFPLHCRKALSRWTLLPNPRAPRLWIFPHPTSSPPTGPEICSIARLALRSAWVCNTCAKNTPPCT